MSGGSLLRPSTALLGTAVVLATALAGVPSAQAAPPSAKVRICHATSSLTNPYVSIEVAQSAVDGDGGNDRGQGDHYLTHTGPVWSRDLAKRDGWGDIIPPIPGIHGGRNWNALGQAIWSAGCRPTAVPDIDDDLRPDVVDDDIDGDGALNVADPDDDGDGTPDVRDPDHPGAPDTDEDGVLDDVDPDDDGDGTPDVEDADDPGSSTDTDEDGLPDWVDSDDDGDGTPDGGDCATVTESTESTESSTGDDVEGNDQDGVDTRSVECREDGTPAPPRDDAGDSDGDGVPNATDRDDDGDGTPDTRDDDQDGDGLPDATDPDDDGDRIPDVLDEDAPEVDVEVERSVDTDGDGTPDLVDRDDDGDGVPDTRDRDADGNGQPETKLLALTSDPLPARIEAGEPTALWEEELLTVLGTPARATVRCSSAFRGDVVGGSRSLCDIDVTSSKGRVTVRGRVPTIVTVVVSAPARGEFRALREVATYRVMP